MWSIKNLFVMDPFIMETRRLVELGKQMNLEGEKLWEFVRTKRALARDEIIRISQEKKEIRIREEKKRGEARIAEEAERARQRKKEDEARIRRHKEEDDDDEDGRMSEE